MKKMSLFVAVLAFGMASHAAVTLTPSVANLYDLDHYRYYVWNMDLNGKVNPSEITSAKITLNSIYDWQWVLLVIPAGGVEHPAMVRVGLRRDEHLEVRVHEAGAGWEEIVRVYRRIRR